ncbi:MAG: aldolase [Alphaproteobacteria bacterium]|nr:aldolase [Alphaproteobacteria bacterium]
MRNDAVWQARVDLAAAYRLAAIHGLNEGVDNHLTLLVPGTTDRFLLIPFGTHWSEVRASSLLIVDLDGRILEGEGIAEDTAFFIHGRLHRAYPEWACIMHTHMPYTLALNLIEDGRIEPNNQNALRFTDRIAFDDTYTGLAFDNSEGDRLARALNGKSILMMRHHGALVCGRSVAEAYDDLYFLERACMTQVLAMSTGRPLKKLSTDIVRETSNQIAGLNQMNAAGIHFSALKRLLDRDQPDYKE